MAVEALGVVVVDLVAGIGVRVVVTVLVDVAFVVVDDDGAVVVDDGVPAVTAGPVVEADVTMASGVVALFVTSVVVESFS